MKSGVYLWAILRSADFRHWASTFGNFHLHSISYVVLELKCTDRRTRYWTFVSVRNFIVYFPESNGKSHVSRLTAGFAAWCTTSRCSVSGFLGRFSEIPLTLENAMTIIYTALLNVPHLANTVRLYLKLTIKINWFDKHH
jgi:hypothetical protein